jgi:hypothetical protein
MGDDDTNFALPGYIPHVDNSIFRPTRHTMTEATSAHIDPNTLTTSSVDGKPVLTTKSNNAAQPAVTGLRQRVNALNAQLDQATDHPAVKGIKENAEKQIDQLRDVLGKSDSIKDLEKRTGIDRVLLVVGGGIL